MRALTKTEVSDRLFVGATSCSVFDPPLIWFTKIGGIPDTVRLVSACQNLFGDGVIVRGYKDSDDSLDLIDMVEWTVTTPIPNLYVLVSPMFVFSSRFGYRMSLDLRENLHSDMSMGSPQNLRQMMHDAMVETMLLIGEAYNKIEQRKMTDVEMENEKRNVDHMNIILSYNKNLFK